jgi:NADPH:quinone reductase
MSLPRSIKIGYAVFFDHIPTPELFRAHSDLLFRWIATGKLKVRIGGEYHLEKAAEAYADMEDRKTTGKLLLVP